MVTQGKIGVVYLTNGVLRGLRKSRLGQTSRDCRRPLQTAFSGYSSGTSSISRRPISAVAAPALASGNGGDLSQLCRPNDLELGARAPPLTHAPSIAADVEMSFGIVTVAKTPRLARLLTPLLGNRLKAWHNSFPCSGLAPLAGKAPH
jgi:hypothetical protein